MKNPYTGDCQETRCEDRHGTLAGKAALSGNQFDLTEDGLIPSVFQDGA